MPWNRPLAEDRIFISYRREDSQGYAGRLADSLTAYFGRDRVFRDIDAIQGGIDFGEEIDRQLGMSGAVLVLIGNSWLTATNEDGQRRLDDPQDLVSKEIAAALDRNVRVIPVLVEDTDMPRKDELPERLRELARRNARSISDENWASDVRGLAQLLSFGGLDSAAERRIERIKLGVVSLLLFAVVVSTIWFARATMASITELHELTDVAATDQLFGFPAAGSSLSFVFIAGACVLLVILSMSVAKPRRLIVASVVLGFLAVLVTFVLYVIFNRGNQDLWHVVPFAVSTMTIVAILALMAMARTRP